jgi:hypothetical protein
MKTFIAIVMSILFMNVAYAGNGPQMHIKVKGVKNLDYLCVNTVGCVNMAAGAKGISFPMHPGTVQRIILVDAKTLRMYPQTIPSSCKIATDDGEKTVTVYGKISQSAGRDPVIKQLRCSVS